MRRLPHGLLGHTAVGGEQTLKLTTLHGHATAWAHTRTHNGFEKANGTVFTTHQTAAASGLLEDASLVSHANTPVHYLENLPPVVVQDLLLESVVAHRLQANQPQHLDERVLLGNAVLDVTVDLEMTCKHTD